MDGAVTQIEPPVTGDEARGPAGRYVPTSVVDADVPA